MEPTLTQSDRPEGFSFTTYLLSFAVAVILYALSPGPVAKCVPILRPRLGRAIDITLAPLQFCYDRSPVVRRFYDWYLKEVWRTP